MFASRKQSRYIQGIMFLIGLSVFAVANIHPTLAINAADKSGKLGLEAAANEVNKDQKLIVKDTSDPNRPAVVTLIGNVIATGLSFIAIIFFILMLYGGLLWMTARGHEDQITQALKTIEAAIIGIIIVVGSYALTTYVLNSAKVADTPAIPAGDTNAPASNSTGRCLDGDGQRNCDGRRSEAFCIQPNFTGEKPCIWNDNLCTWQYQCGSLNDLACKEAIGICNWVELGIPAGPPPSDEAPVS